MGDRAPFVILSKGGIRIQNVKTVDGSDGKQLDVTVETHKYAVTEKMLLIGALYDDNGVCVKTYTQEITSLTSDEIRTFTLNFGLNTTDYTCKIYLWDSESLTPYCPQWTVGIDYNITSVAGGMYDSLRVYMSVLDDDPTEEQIIVNEQIIAMDVDEDENPPDIEKEDLVWIDVSQIRSLQKSRLSKKRV